MSSTGRYDPYAIAAAVARPHAHRSLTQVEGKKADLARDPAAFTAVAIESDDDDDAPQESGFTKIQIADEDSSDEEVVEINQSGGFELPSPTEDEVLRKFETMDEDELIVEEVPVAGTKITIEDDDSVEEVPVKTGGTKVAIEDSSEDEENLLVAETVPESLKPDPPSKGVKVAIEDDDDDEPPPPDVSPAKSSDGSWEVVGDAAKAEALKGEGNELMKKGDVSGAVAKYSAALEADAQHYASRANRAMARLRLGDVEGAFLDADACCQHADVATDVSKRVKALFRRGDARERLAASSSTPKAKVVELEASLTDLDEVVRLEPRNDVAVAKRRAVSEALAKAKALVREAAQAPAKATTEKGQYEGDFAASDKAKAAGSKALAAGKLDEAEVLYTQALDAWPGNAAARNNRALVRLKRDDFEGCASDTSEVLKSDPKNLKALYRRGVARRALGDFGGSLDDLDALLALAPGDRAATTEREATRRKIDERDGLQRKRTKGVVKLDAVVPSKASLVKPPSPSKKVIAVDTPPPPPSTKAPPAPPKQNTEEKIQKAVAAARSRNAKKVPTKAPKTASELERTWRELKGDPELWSEYLGIFKKKTLEKLDISLCPEVLVDIIGSASAMGAKAASVLLGASKAPGWAVTKALLSKEDLARVAAVADAADAEAGEKLRAGYGL
jgi:tetratricopeptide (TPR) repeat protein